MHRPTLIWQFLNLWAQVLLFLGWFGLVHCRPVSLIYWTRRWGQFTILSLYQIPVAKAPLIIYIFLYMIMLSLINDSMLYLLCISNNSIRISCEQSFFQVFQLFSKEFGSQYCCWSSQPNFKRDSSSSILLRKCTHVPN